MKLILEVLFVFAFCACFGWCLEVCYRSYNAKKFINPGFLSGCYLPVYGFGGTALYYGCSYLLNIENVIARVLAVFLFGCIAMTFIEFIGGIFLLKYYNLRLWDYSDNPLNYKGVICLPFAFAWGAVCLFFAYALYPFINEYAQIIDTQQLFILMIGFYYGIFFFDLYESLHIADMIKKRYSETVVYFEEFKQKAKSRIKERKDTVSLADYIQFNYIEKYLEETKNRLEDFKEEVLDNVEEFKENIEDIKEDIEDFKEDIEEFGKDIKQSLMDAHKGKKEKDE